MINDLNIDNKVRNTPVERASVSKLAARELFPGSGVFPYDDNPTSASLELPEVSTSRNRN
jgi:hypothetical protein